MLTILPLYSPILQWVKRKRKIILFPFFNGIAIDQNNYSVLALQSLSIDSNHLPKLDIYFYPPLFSCSKDDKRVMTAIYIKSDLEYSTFNPTFLGTVENNADPQPLEGFYYTGATVKFKNQMISNVSFTIHSQVGLINLDKIFQ